MKVETVKRVKWRRIPMRFSLGALLLLLTAMAPICWYIAKRVNRVEPSVVIRITSSGQMFVDDHRVKPGELKDRLARQLAIRKEQGLESTLTIYADSQSKQSELLKVFTAAGQLDGVQRISIRAGEPVIDKMARAARKLGE